MRINGKFSGDDEVSSVISWWQNFNSVTLAKRSSIDWHELGQEAKLLSVGKNNHVWRMSTATGFSARSMSLIQYWFYIAFQLWIHIPHGDMTHQWRWKANTSQSQLSAYFNSISKWPLLHNGPVDRDVQSTKSVLNKKEAVWVDDSKHAGGKEAKAGKTEVCCTFDTHSCFDGARTSPGFPDPKTEPAKCALSESLRLPLGMLLRKPPCTTLNGTFVDLLCHYYPCRCRKRQRAW